MSKELKFIECPDDGLIAQNGIGIWAEEKHELINRYIQASFGARRKFDKNSSYIELFCGPGRAKIKHIDRFIDGSAVTAWRQSNNKPGHPFGKVLIADAHKESLSACSDRLARIGAPVQAFHGPAHETIDSVVRELTPTGLHLAVIDPYNIGHLHFGIIEKLSKFKRMDMLIHFSTMDILRNTGLNQLAKQGVLDNAIPGWRDHVQLGEKPDIFVPKLFAYWAELISSLGLCINVDRAVPIKNGDHRTIYYFVHVAHHELAHDFWESVRTPKQPGLF